jgi:hypothetical protein
MKPTEVEKRKTDCGADRSLLHDSVSACRTLVILNKRNRGCVIFLKRNEKIFISLKQNLNSDSSQYN